MKLTSRPLALHQREALAIRPVVRSDERPTCNARNVSFVIFFTVDFSVQGRAARSAQRTSSAQNKPKEAKELSGVVERKKKWYNRLILELSLKTAAFYFIVLLLFFLFVGLFVFFAFPSLLTLIVSILIETTRYTAAQAAQNNQVFVFGSLRVISIHFLK